MCLGSFSQFPGYCSRSKAVFPEWSGACAAVKAVVLQVWVETIDLINQHHITMCTCPPRDSGRRFTSQVQRCWYHLRCLRSSRGERPLCGSCVYFYRPCYWYAWLQLNILTSFNAMKRAINISKRLKSIYSTVPSRQKKLIVVWFPVLYILKLCTMCFFFATETVFLDSLEGQGDRMCRRGSPLHITVWQGHNINHCRNTTVN